MMEEHGEIGTELSDRFLGEPGGRLIYDQDTASKNEQVLTTTTTAHDWTGPDDPENPRNWSTAKKIYHVLIPTLFGFVVYGRKTSFYKRVQLTSVPQLSRDVSRLANY
jgi:hypothetical protein